MPHKRVYLFSTHNLLARDTWQGATLREVVSETLIPFVQGERSRIQVAGPEIRLGPTAAITLGMAIHELTDNAAKYGALSIPDGCVSVTWELDLDGGWQPALDLLWRDEGGPKVIETRHQGFSLRLIEEGVAREGWGGDD